MALVGAGAAVKQGPEMLEKVTNSVKSIMTSHELSQIASTMEMDSMGGTRVPGPGQAEALARYINSTFTSKSGRDPAMDLWGNPYRTDRLDDGRLILLSVGPNGTRDDCDGGGDAAGAGHDDADDVCCLVTPVLPQDSPYRSLKEGH